MKKYLLLILIIPGFLQAGKIADAMNKEKFIDTTQNYSLLYSKLMLTFLDQDLTQARKQSIHSIIDSILAHNTNSLVIKEFIDNFKKNSFFQTKQQKIFLNYLKKQKKPLKEIKLENKTKIALEEAAYLEQLENKIQEKLAKLQDAPP